MLTWFYHNEIFVRESWQIADLTFKGANIMFTRITFDPMIMGGQACIRGMRIPVSVIVGQVAHGASFDEILEDYPDLERPDIEQALQYAAWLTREQVHVS